MQSGLYPIYEIFDGERIAINVEPDFSAEALERYFAGQGRFRKVGVELAAVRAGIDRHWRRLRAWAAVSAG